jgi:hypothetical protein
MSQLFTENVGASTSHNPMGLHGLLQGWLYPFTLPQHEDIWKGEGTAPKILNLTKMKVSGQFFQI